MNTLTLNLPLGRLGHGIGQFASPLLTWVAEMRKQAEMRRAVARMDEHMLADIGVSRAQMTFEIEREHRWRLFG
jgi:uncharacterized protein YjiS (DUF1127 family)